MKKVDLSQVKRVLIIRHKAIGDIILVTPFIRAIKKALPDAEIDMLVEPMGIEILKGNPYLANVVVYEKNRLKKANPFVKIVETVRFYMKLFGRRYDLVFDLWGNLRTALMSFLTGAKYRVGFHFRIRKYLYNIIVVPDEPPKYNAYFHMDQLKALGIPDDGEKADFYIFPGDIAFADDFYRGIGVKAGDTVFGLNGAGTWKTKRWPEHKFAELADILIKKHSGCKIVIIWGPSEKPMAEKIYSMIKGDRSGVFLTPPTTLKQLGAVQKRMDAFISNDGRPTTWQSRLTSLRLRFLGRQITYPGCLPAINGTWKFTARLPARRAIRCSAPRKPNAWKVSCRMQSLTGSGNYWKT